MVEKMDKVDVVTVGVGWTGGIIAAELSKAGYKVVGLERGGERETEDYYDKHDHLNYAERHEVMHHLPDNTVTFRNNLDQTAAPVRETHDLQIGTDVGGGGLHWAAQTHRYFPYDFEIYSRTVERYGEEKIPEDMSLQDWGITYDELEPYYDKFEKTMGTSGEEDPLAAERSSPYPTPPLKKTKAMKLFQEATENLGYHPYVIPAGTISEQYENPDGQTLNACQYSGFCSRFACEWGARASPNITVIPTAQETDNFELRTRSNVTRVLYDGDRATSVIYEDTQTGEEFEQPADIVVLTSYTFNNVRLLLLSEIGEPYDPETGEGIIGKNFTDHHTSGQAIGFFEDRKFNRYISTGALGMTYEDFNADNFDHSDVDFIHGGHIEMRENGENPIQNNHVPNGTPLWGKEFKEKSLYYFYRSFALNIQMATMPFEDHYLDLDPNYKDEKGDPLLRLTWDYKDNELNMSKFLVEKSAETLREMGADIVDEDHLPEHFTPQFTFMHNAGGAIMGDDPETSAVNNYMQMWNMDNLFVCGASALPHFSATNPTLTVGALTYRAAEGIEEYLNNGGGQLVSSKKSNQKA
ncbi:GMC family oxidoreductase [Salicibibacter cibarius]|uniref:GMC family oxidoreductase n=1 Tax=Salicibibacter cibarius TaxID=2743000 RepID=A0A7T6Z5B8_9BACI|nr:GMC family oxidoreductase [Salicibibacter cibarius]QQK77280.1 GMC family oxidoreductase [Salicibibacter cibarius]